MAVPYSPVRYSAHGTPYVQCPVCGVNLILGVRKDAESWSTLPYAEHVQAEHPDRVVDLSRRSDDSR
jgi:hypothetical protein